MYERLYDESLTYNLLIVNPRIISVHKTLKMIHDIYY